LPFQSKTYDSVTEKYLDFSFEKTNSAYMLFYEWRSNRGGNEQRDQFDTPTTSATAVANELNLLHQKLKETQAKQQAMEAEALKSTTATDTPEAATSKTDGADSATTPGGPADDGDSLVRSKSETEIKDIDNSIIKATNLDIVKNKCDIEIKRLALLATPPPPPPPLPPPSSSTSTSSASAAEGLGSVVVAAKPAAATPSSSLPKRKLVVKSSHRSLLSKELEDWIWQDNRHFLQDKNVFEHTYFK
jgi:ubiquitin carboxyl-terminal hydrolase 34